MNRNDITIRLEKEEDYTDVEFMIRESFWNVYRPGALEHFVIHVLRDDPAFVKELDFVMEKKGQLIGQNMFMKTVIETDDGSVCNVLTMGPICITPELKRKGYGKALIKKLARMAVDEGCGRLEWSCLDWNTPSINFYLSLGAQPMDGWTTYRLTGDTLENMAK